uniref:SFRICE_010452 n=1 Tax=Spodoptera frugiperda TaxID=7108 RepID=A0A2H1VL94_SPOFR
MYTYKTLRLFPMGVGRDNGPPIGTNLKYLFCFINSHHSLFMHACWFSIQWSTEKNWARVSHPPPPRRTSHSPTTTPAGAGDITRARAPATHLYVKLRCRRSRSPLTESSHEAFPYRAVLFR